MSSQARNLTKLSWISNPPTEHYVFDVGSLVYCLAWKKGDSYGAIAQSYADFTIRHYGKATVVFDGYSKGPSIKDNTHQGNGSVVWLYFQIMVWIGNEGDMNTVDRGWKLVDNRFLPVMTSKAAAPESLLQMIHCNCTTACQTTVQLQGIWTTIHACLWTMSSWEL